MNQSFMRERPVLGLVISMSIPMVISMMVNSLYNIVDSYFVAQISEEAMTALSLVYPVQNLINAVTIGFAIGINAVIAFYLGARETRSASDAAARGLLLNALHGLLLTILCIAVMPAFLRSFTSDEAVISYGLRYSHIVFGFAVILSLGVSFEKIFQATGNMMVSMVSLLAGCMANIILDPIMIFGLGPVPRMGIEGAALATGIGQLLSLVIYLAVWKFSPSPLSISPRQLLPGHGITRRLYAIGVPAALNLALPSLLISSLNAILAGYSQTYVLVLGAYYKLQTFLYLSANGIIQGIRPLVGYNYGAGELKRVRSIYHTALALSAAIMAAGTALCLLIPDNLIRLFTSNEATVQAGAHALRIISAGFIVSSVSVTSSGALEGLSMGLPSFLISLLRYIVIMIPAAFLLSRQMGADGVWHAFWITELATAAAALLIYRRKTSVPPSDPERSCSCASKSSSLL